MSITSGMVKELREKTGVGMMDCKKALVETQGDIENAIKYLRERGVAVADKKSDRSTKEGRVFTAVSGNSGVILELNCETDFVANNDAFRELGAALASVALDQASINTPEALESAQIESKTVKEKVSEVVLQVGENLVIGKLERVNATSAVSKYEHANGKIGVLVASAGDLSEDLGKDIAMQVAAASPLYVQDSEVPAEEIEKEKEILRNQDGMQGKPAEIVEKIIEGKVSKYCKEICLLDQPFIKDDKKSVKELLPSGVTIERFVRYALT